MSVNNGGKSLIFAGLMDEQKSHRSLSLFSLSFAALQVCNAFSVWNKIGRKRVDVALQNLDNYCTTNNEVTCKRPIFNFSTVKSYNEVTHNMVNSKDSSMGCTEKIGYIFMIKQTNATGMGFQGKMGGTENSVSTLHFEVFALCVPWSGYMD